MAEPVKPLPFDLQRSFLPISVVVAVVASAITGTLWVQGTLLGLEYKIDRIDSRVSAVAESLADRWRTEDQTKWAELLQAANPSLKVPAPHR